MVYNILSFPFLSVSDESNIRPLVYNGSYTIFNFVNKINVYIMIIYKKKK